MKLFTGKVVSKKMEKTVTITVDRVRVHPTYKKRYKRTKKYHVHDELGAEVGQMVRFVASKPYSKTKRWKVIEVVGGRSDKKQMVVQRKSQKKERRGK